MKNVRLIISLVLIVHGMVVSSQYQVLDVCIQVAVDQSFRKGTIPADELDKYGRFGIVESPPFDKYFRVSSALYDDYLDIHQCVELKKNLLTNIPTMIKDDLVESALFKQYRFPKFLPKTCIEKIENSQKEGRPFQHVIYKNKSNGNTKTLALRYWIGEAVERAALPRPFAISMSQVENKQPAQSLGDQVIEVLSFLSLFILPITE